MRSRTETVTAISPEQASQATTEVAEWTGLSPSVLAELWDTGHQAVDTQLCHLHGRSLESRYLVLGLEFPLRAQGTGGKRVTGVRPPRVGTWPRGNHLPHKPVALTRKAGVTTARLTGPTRTEQVPLV